MWPRSVAMESSRNSRSGTSPTDRITVSAGRVSPEARVTPWAVISLVKQGHWNLAPTASASFFSLPKAAGFWMSMSVMSLAPRRAASVATSQPTLPAPMMTTRLPTMAVPFLAALRKVSAGVASSLPGTGSRRGLLAPTARTVKSKSSHDLAELVAGQGLAQLDVGQDLPRPGRSRP